MALTAERAGERLSRRLGILDEWIALDIDQAAMIRVEAHRDRKEELRLNSLMTGTAARVLNAFAGAEGDPGDAGLTEWEQENGQVFVNGPKSGDEGRINAAPVIDTSGHWWETTSIPQAGGRRVVDFNDPDVI